MIPHVVNFTAETAGDLSRKKPLVSIITVSLNAEKTMRETIESVLHQTYEPIEYLVIDGGSIDGTRKIIQEYGDRISVFVSEKDRGISDAFNKGISKSRGEFVQILNADDWLDSPMVASAVSLLQSNASAAFVYGDLSLIEGREDELEDIPGDPEYRTKLRYTMPAVNHPTMVVRRGMFDKYGLFDLNYHIAMDYDWILRLHNGGEWGLYSPLLKAYKRKGGISGQKRFEAFRECRRISVRNGFNPVLAYGYYLLRCFKDTLLVSMGKR